MKKGDRVRVGGRVGIITEMPDDSGNKYPGSYGVLFTETDKTWHYDKEYLILVDPPERLAPITDPPKIWILVDSEGVLLRAYQTKEMAMKHKHSWYDAQVLEVELPGLRRYPTLQTACSEGGKMTNFERNFWKASAVCPKCGLSEPLPKYIPAKPPRSDKVVCQCRCGYEWEAK